MPILYLSYYLQASGLANDRRAWEFTSLKRALDNELLPHRFNFIGDDAFTCSDQFLVPWGHNLIKTCKR